jgi:hypothetical protein
MMPAVSKSAAAYLLEQSLLFNGAEPIPNAHTFDGWEPQDLDVFCLG